MIPATKLVYDFDRKYNNSNRGDRSLMNLVDVLAYLNEAQGIWYEQMAHLYQTTNFISSELQQFHETDRSLTKSGDFRDGEKFTLPKNMYKRLNQKAVVKHPECCGDQKKTIPIRIDTSDEINEVLNNPLFKPDFAWERLSGIESGGELHVYTGEMDVCEVVVDYLRFPRELHAPSLIDSRCTPQQYETYAGEIITEDQDFEPCARFSERKVVDIAVMIALGDQKDYQGFQKQLQLIMFGDYQLKN